MRQLKGKRLNKNIILYLIYVIISSIFWFLNALSKDYSTEITYPVKYTNFPNGQYPITNLPSELQLSVKAKGFTLLGHKIRTSFLPITFNIGSYYNPKSSDKFILHTNEIKDKIGVQLNAEIQLLSVLPEEIVFQFAKAKKKKVAIRPQVDYTLKRQYIVDQISVQPDSIWIEGPANILDTLRSIPTQTIRLKNISKNTIRSTELLPPPQCKIDDLAVKIEILAEQFTEARKNIPLISLHVPDSMRIRLFPDHIDVSYEIGLSKYDKITDKDFCFAIDYPHNTDISHLEVKVVRAPKFIKNLSFSPQKVEYILEKR